MLAGSARPSSSAISTLQRAGSASSAATAEMSASPVAGISAASRMADLLGRLGVFGSSPPGVPEYDDGAEELDHPAGQYPGPHPVGETWSGRGVPADEGHHRSHHRNTHRNPHQSSEIHDARGQSGTFNRHCR